MQDHLTAEHRRYLDRVAAEARRIMEEGDDRGLAVEVAFGLVGGDVALMSLEPSADEIAYVIEQVKS